MKRIWIVAITACGMLIGLGGTLVGVYFGSFPSQPFLTPDNISPGVPLRQESPDRLKAELDQLIATTPARAMTASGLAAVTGGAHLKLTSSAPAEVILPIPQQVDGQVPVCYVLDSTPAGAIAELRLRTRDDGNVVAGVRLAGGDGEVQLAWTAVVLLAPQATTLNPVAPERYRTSTPCAQADSGEISRLANQLWPKSGRVAEFAANIQRHLRESKRKERPVSLDAVGILRSGENSICTANANLAVALMRVKGIACRSVAVVPPIAQRLEMHRVVEFLDDQKWHTFDPSSLQPDIPARPWQNIIMAKTTIADELLAMRPRMGAMVGTPYGQELEILGAGISFWGQDFFWTKAQALAEFEPSAEAIRLATERWQSFLETGRLTTGQCSAASAKSSEELVQVLRTE